MYKITESYVDYDGNERKEDFYFNFTEAELAKMELSVTGGLTTIIQRAIDAKDVPSLIKIFEDLISKSYGQKSLDGRRFVKSPEILEEFKQTEAYSQIYMRMATDEKAAAEFVNNVMPKKTLNAATSHEKAKVLPMNN
jgi:hypothetical protein